MTTPRLPPITEAEFARQVLALARLRGWLCYHTHDSRRSAAGFPDLVFVRERVVWVELKTARGRVRPEQQRWLDALGRAGQEVYLFRPGDWARIEEVLR